MVEVKSSFLGDGVNLLIRMLNRLMDILSLFIYFVFMREVSQPIQPIRKKEEK